MNTIRLAPSVPDDKLWDVTNQLYAEGRKDIVRLILLQHTLDCWRGEEA